MASTDARPVPIKNTAFRAIFPIYDADGDLVTGATGLDSEVSLDQAAFADCTNEATEIATSSGMYYLDLTSTEMNADCVAVIVKTSSTGAKTTVLVFYPEETGDINVDVTAFGGTAATTSGGRPEVNTTHAAGTAWGSGAITAAAIADGAIDAATFAAGAINAAAIATDAIDSDAIAATAVTELQAGLSTLDAAGVRAAVGLAAANLDTQLSAIDDYLDTEIAAIKAVTDLFTSAQAEPSGVPAANATPMAKIAWLAALARNKITQTATQNKLYADDGLTVIGTATVSDDGTTATRGEFA